MGDKKLKTKDFKNDFILSREKNGLGLGGPQEYLKGEEINNLAAGITSVCQAASFKRNKGGYKNPERFGEPQGLEEARQSWVEAGVRAGG